MSLASRIRRLLSRLKNRAPQTMENGVGKGLRFIVGPANPEYGTGTNELPVQEALRTILGQGQTFVDVGANVGFFTVIASRLVGPGGRVVAFEPIPANARLVRRNVRLNGFKNVEVHEEAVSDQVGEAELILAEYAGGAALASAPPPPDARGSLRVRTTSLDAAVAEGRIPDPDVVKIDVEGAEYEVLAGMARILAHVRPTLLLEFDGRTEEEVRRKLDECTALLEASGYGHTTLPDSYDGAWVVRHVLASPAVA